MALSITQQVSEILNRSRHILITFPAQAGSDAVATSLALGNWLEKKGLRVDIIADRFELPGVLRFLPGSKKITAELSGLRKFVLSLSLSKTPLNDFSYSIENDKLNIYLTPKHGSWQAQDLTTEQSDFVYDLIFVINSPDLASLGDIYKLNSDFFFKTTIINVDHLPSNEHYGQINLVDINLPSASEIIFNLLSELDKNLIDEDIATCLLTGLTAATKSFSTIQVTPETLSQAAKLINLGARREEVVTHLYRTKQLNTLKLWGRALARLKSDSGKKIVWSVLPYDDFIKAGAGEEELPSVIDELITNSPEAGTVALLYENKPNNVKVFIHTGLARHALDMLKPFNGQGDKTKAWAELNDISLLEAEKKVIDHLKLVTKILE